jgi:hypothetical protein
MKCTAEFAETADSDPDHYAALLDGFGERPCATSSCAGAQQFAVLRYGFQFRKIMSWKDGARFDGVGHRADKGAGEPG